jgi:hypothetical protein
MPVQALRRSNMEGGAVNSQGAGKALRSWIVVQALWLAAPATAAVASQASQLPPPPASTRDLELGEILVSGAKKVRDPEAVLKWLQRLVGKFDYEGYVELRTEGAPQGRLPVRGAGECIGFGPGPGVQCAMRVNWPKVRGPNGEDVLGGVSSLTPAMTLYGYDADFIAIHFQQVDNKGLADSGRGYLTGDVLTTRASCVYELAGCERIMHISAEPGGRLIQTQIDIEQNSTLVVRFVFVQHLLSRPGEADAAGERR